MSLKSTLTISNVNKIKHGEQVEVYEKDIIDLKYQNEKLQKTLIFKESLDVTLASRDIDLAKAEADVEELKAANNNLRLYAKQKIEDKDSLLQKQQKQIQD